MGTLMDCRLPQLCATVTADWTAGLRASRDQVAGADLVELRLDGVADPDVPAALAGRRLPAIVTCRPAGQGGRFRGSEDERKALLMQAFDAGAEYVDLEWGHGFDQVVRHRQGRGIVLSHHDFTGVPGDLESIAVAMAASDAEVIKLAVAVASLADCARLLGVARRLRGRRAVLIGMGEAGVMTRVLPGRFGSCWTYAGASVAPGQLSVGQMLQEFTFRRLGTDTVLYGILGRPLGHSLSPAMHNAAFASLGVDAAYVPLPAAGVDDFFASADALGIAGASVTAPFKVAAVAHMTTMDPVAAEIGALNTVVRGAGGWHGANTDAAGFLASLAGLPLAGWRAAVLGTGGAARAAALSLRDAGCAVTCYGRDEAKAQALASALRVAGAVRPVPAGSWDLLVNTTPAGTHPNAGESSFPEAVYDGRLVYDMVYNPAATRLLREAGARGCRTLGGLGMLVEQARLQSAMWTRMMPDRAVMHGAAESKLASFTDAT